MERALAVFGCMQSHTLSVEATKAVGLEVDSAHTFSEAAARLNKSYNLVLLQLDIPFEDGGTPRAQNGINLLRKIKLEMKGARVLTFGFRKTTRLETVVEVMKLAATDFVPLPCKDGINSKIISALSNSPADDRVACSEFSKERRVLIIFPRRITICGAEVWTSRGDEDLRRSLILMAEKRGDEYVKIRGVDLMERFGRDENSSIRRPIKEFRDKATRVLASQGIFCGRDDIIATSGGYHFAPNIDVRIEDGDAKPQDAIARALAGVPAGQFERLAEMCARIGTSGIPRRDLRKASDVSKAQFERDIHVLVERGVIKKGGARGARIYKLSNALSAHELN